MITSWLSSAPNLIFAYQLLFFHTLSVLLIESGSEEIVTKKSIYYIGLYNLTNSKDSKYRQSNYQKSLPTIKCILHPRGGEC